DRHPGFGDRQALEASACRTLRLVPHSGEAGQSLFRKDSVCFTEFMTQVSDARISKARTLTRAQENRFRKRLEKDFADELQLIEQLVADMESFLETRRDVPTDDEHDPEGPTLAFERSQSNAILQQVRQRSIDTANALERLKNGTYGICQSCSGQI